MVVVTARVVMAVAVAMQHNSRNNVNVRRVDVTMEVSMAVAVTMPVTMPVAMSMTMTMTVTMTMSVPVSVAMELNLYRVGIGADACGGCKRCGLARNTGGHERKDSDGRES